MRQDPTPTRRQLAERMTKEELIDEVVRLDGLINTPQVIDFLEAVRTEAAHQRERWGEDHDSMKRREDWFWLIGYLAGKVIRPAQTKEKRLHRIITIAAAALNWHRHEKARKTVSHSIPPPDDD
jgi:hypothetical protein